MNRWRHSIGGDKHHEEYARLEEIYGNDIAEVDIVLVAGLGGHYLRTWEGSDRRRTMWPRDLLPLHVKTVRVFSFQYTTTIKGTTDHVRISDHALTLLDKLDIHLRDGDPSCPLKPIIFIGHSLGGMLIKEAISTASRRRNTRYADIWDASRGVMFFATPHHGLDSTSWPDFAVQILQLSGPFPGVPPTERMLKEISMNSIAMLEITEEFARLQNDLAFVNFCEGNTMQPLRKVLVNKSHGWMDAPLKRQLILEGDHIGICQFRWEDEASFRLVSEGVRYLMEQSPKALDQINELCKRVLRSLCPSGFHGYFMAKEATEGTCNWIEKRQKFQDWLDDDNDTQMLWIRGPPASGKSYLAKHIINEIAPKANQEVAHCFLSDSVPGRGNIEALLRATLHHALRLHPDLIAEHLVPPFNEATKNSDKTDSEIWTRDLLTPMWPTVVGKVTSRSSLTLVVDGFDELGIECQQGFLDCLAAFKAAAKSDGQIKRLRVLLLSREDAPSNGLDDNGGDNMAVQPRHSLTRLPDQVRFETYNITRGDTIEDVKKTVMAQLKEIYSTRSHEYQNSDPTSADKRHQEMLEEKQKAICDAVLEGSDGTYMRPTLVIEELKQLRPAAGEPSKETTFLDASNELLVELLKKLPRDPSEIQERMLRQMHDRKSERDLSLVRQVLRWAVYQKDELLAAEMELAVTLGMMLDVPSDVSSEKVLRDSANTINTPQLEDMARRVKTLVQVHCGQAVYLQDGRLQLANGGIKESLKKMREAPMESTNNSPEISLAYLDEGLSHTALASTCITYLTLPYFQDASKPTVAVQLDRNITAHQLWEAKVRKRIKTHPFVRYAALYWFKHLEAGRKQTTPLSNGARQGDEKARRLLQDSATAYAQCWTEVWWFLTKQFVTGPESSPLQNYQASSVIRACGLEAYTHAAKIADGKQEEQEEQLIPDDASDKTIYHDARGYPVRKPSQNMLAAGAAEKTREPKPDTQGGHHNRHDRSNGDQLDTDVKSEKKTAREQSMRLSGIGAARQTQQPQSQPAPISVQAVHGVTQPTQTILQSSKATERGREEPDSSKITGITGTTPASNIPGQDKADERNKDVQGGDTKKKASPPVVAHNPNRRGPTMLSPVASTAAPTTALSTAKPMITPTERSTPSPALPLQTVGGKGEVAASDKEMSRRKRFVSRFKNMWKGGQE